MNTGAAEKIYMALVRISHPSGYYRKYGAALRTDFRDFRRDNPGCFSFPGLCVDALTAGVLLHRDGFPASPLGRRMGAWDLPGLLGLVFLTPALSFIVSLALSFFAGAGWLRLFGGYPYENAPLTDWILRGSLLAAGLILLCMFSRHVNPRVRGEGRLTVPRLLFLGLLPVASAALIAGP